MAIDWCFLFIISAIHSSSVKLVSGLNQACSPDSALCRHHYPLDYPSSDWNTIAVLGPNDMKDKEFAESSCHCDDECNFYGDCCPDATMKYGSDGLNLLWTCLPVKQHARQRFNEKFSIYVIGECPSDGQEEFAAVDLSAKCERTLMDSPVDDSHLVDVPVLSLDTNRTYANIYCAQCHSDADHLATWDVSYQCNMDFRQFNISMEYMFQPAHYVVGERQWVDYELGIFCDLIIQQLQDVTAYAKVTGGRRCLPSIEKCLPHWTNPVDNQKCESYTLYVQHKSSGRIFKNPDCARCNQIMANETVCLTVKPSVTLFKDYIGGRFAFSGIMDFSLGGSDRVGLQKKCKANEIFDHLSSRCHAIVCGVTYTNLGGICHPNEPKDRSTDRWLNSSCPRLSLTSQIDFVRLENKSIILNGSGQILDPQEYEPGPDGQNITICADQSHQTDYFKYSEGQRYLSDVCLSISLIGLAAHISIHLALPKLRNVPGKNLLSLSCGLFIGQLLFLTAIGSKEQLGADLCSVIGAAIHWSYLSAFFWMSVMGFDIWRTFSGSQFCNHSVGGQHRRHLYWTYFTYALGTPMMIVALGLALDLTPGLSDYYAPQYGAHLCWICNKRGLAIFFVLPIMLLLVTNTILFSLTVLSIVKQKRAGQFAVEKSQTGQVLASARSTNRDGQQIRFVLYVKLAVIMGLGWISGFVAAMADLPGLWYPFIVLNATQGAFIFLAFNCKRKIYYMLYRRLMKRPHPADTSITSFRGRNNTTSKPGTICQSHGMVSESVRLTLGHIRSLSRNNPSAAKENLSVVNDRQSIHSKTVLLAQ